MTRAAGLDRGTIDPAKRGGMGRALFNTLIMAAGFALCVVGARGRWTAARPWGMVGVYVLVHVMGTLRIVRFNPELLPERARRGRQGGQPFADKVLLWAFSVSYRMASQKMDD